MPTEIEAKFLNVNHDLIRTRLRELGARCTQANRLMKRITMDFADKRLRHTANGWVRLRDEGDKITLTYKQMNDRSLHGMKEVEVVVDDFSKAELFLRALGVERSAYQETKRESWELEEVEVDLDEWPWIHPFVEVEGPNEAAVWQAVERLGLNRAQAQFGGVEVAYLAQYRVTEEEINGWKEVTFSDTPAWLIAKARA